MVATTYQTSMETMQLAAQHVLDVSNSIQSQLTQLDGQIEPVASTWQGAGGSAFQALHQRWLEDAKKIQTVLTQISEGITLNAKQYTAAEDNASSSMTRTAAQL